MDRQAKKLQVVREEEGRFGTDDFVDEDDTEVRDILLGEISSNAKKISNI